LRSPRIEGDTVNFSELQRALQRNVMHADTEVLSEVNDTQKVPVNVRLGVYSNGYRWRLIEVLADTYEQLSVALGEEAFFELALEYLESTRPSIFLFAGSAGTSRVICVKREAMNPG